MSYPTMFESPVRSMPPECIDLSPEDFHQAIQLSDPITSEQSQWQTYLHGLALVGFVTWLRERMPDLSVQPERSSLWQPPLATAIAAVCNLQAGPFSLCLLATSQVWADQITVPRAVLDLPEFAAHFYVVIEVQEEQEQLVIHGIARYDELDAYRQS